MSQLEYWIQPLQGYLLARPAVRASLPQIRAVRFVRHWEGPDPTVLWLGEGAEIRSFLEISGDLSGVTLFAAGDATGLLSLAESRSVNLVITRLELLDLHERLSAVLRRHQEWNVLLLRAAGRRHSIQDVVDTAAELAGGALFLLNAGCRVVYFGGRACLDSAPAREMLERGLLSPNTARDLLEEGRTDSAAPLCRVMGSEGRCWSRRVLQDDSLISHMLLFTPPPRLV